MEIAIIGAGSVGGALGTNWAARGHRITYGVGQVDDPKHEALRRQGSGRVGFSSPAEAAAGHRVIVLAVPWDAAQAALGALAGKLLIDCTNPLGTTRQGLGLVVGFEESGGERIAGWAAGASVFKTLNQTGFGVMAEPRRYSPPPAMFVAGAAGPDKTLVLGLVGELGFEAVDAGPLDAARLLEPLAMLWINLALKRGLGRDFAFGLVRPAQP